VTTDQTLAISVGSERLSWTLSELDAAWNAFASAMGAPTHSRSAAKHESVPATKDAIGQPAGAERTSRQKPRVCLITGLGINADRELAAAFEVAGASVEAVHASQLLSHSVSLRGYGVVAVPGGFSYGDHVGSGMMLAHRLQALRGDFDRHVEQGGLVIGICNGFQVLVKMGILPNTDGTWTRSASLVHNSGGTFEDSWVTVGRNPDCKSPWLTGVSRIDLPIRHGEGRFVTGSDEVITTLRDSGQIALRYVERNPNGSQDDVAGIVDPTGRILGLMPHPEAFLVPENHPHWRDNSRPGRDTEVGLILFENAVRWALEAV
jgi:phosphoribosylformylglycinamidine synthase